MKKKSNDLDQRVVEIKKNLKREFYDLSVQTENFVKRTPHIDKLDDLQERLYEARSVLHIMKDILIGHGRKAINKFEEEICNEPNSDVFVDKLQNYIIGEIPDLIKSAMLDRIK